jgi:hypothetical protein
MLALVNPLNGVFGEAWQLYRAHWAHFTSIALVVFLALAAIGIVLGFLLGDFGVFLGWFGLRRRHVLAPGDADRGGQ